MTPEERDALRAPFPPEAIGKLPRVICPNCSKSQSKVCQEHTKQKCNECGNYMTTRHIHLDYVGHAAVRDRLLMVDSAWTWEPAATNDNGVPLLADGGLWIRMTVAGVTRYGWGDGPDVKQMISDAIRNAAMTFGVALDLWSKEDLHAVNQSEGGSTDGVAVGDGAQGSPSRSTSRPADERSPSDSSPAVEAGEHPAAANGGAVSSASPTSQGAASETPPPDAAPASPNRVQQLQSKLSAMLAEGVKGVAAQRSAESLPKLDENCTPVELDGWADLLNRLDPNMNRVAV